MNEQIPTRVVEDDDELETLECGAMSSTASSPQRVFCQEYYPALRKIAKTANVTEACVAQWAMGHRTIPGHLTEQIENLRKLRSPHSSRLVFCDEYHRLLTETAKDANVTKAKVVRWALKYRNPRNPPAYLSERLEQLRALRARPLLDEQKEALLKERRERERERQPQKRCTITMRQLQQDAHADKEEPLDVPRPKRRADCESSERPCPWAGCRHNLFLDINRNGSLQLATRDGVESMPASCALDVADRGGHTLLQVAQFLGVSRERVRQVEAKALARFSLIAKGLR